MFSISLLGDVMLGRLVPLPNKIDEDVINFLQESSLNIANLECVVTDRSEVKSQLINKPKKFMCKHGANQKQGLLLKKLKVGCCNFANNHILDYGFHGVKDTIQFFNETGLKWFGFGKNWETAWKPRILRLASNADSEPTILKVALFGISDHFVEWKADNGAGINYFNINNFQNAEQNLNRAKWQAFDYISEQIDKGIYFNFLLIKLNIFLHNYMPYSQLVYRIFLIKSIPFRLLSICRFHNINLPILTLSQCEEK